MTRDNEKSFKHPSYGMISLCRTSNSRSARLFGSSLNRHYNTVRLTIDPGEMIRDNYIDRYYGGMHGELIDVELSADQFADMITSMNRGPGTPCTIRRIGNQQIEPPPDITTQVEHIKNNFKEALGNQSTRTQSYRTRIDEILEKQKMSAKAREEIRIALDVMQQAIDSNIPFMLERFTEATRDVVTAAKHEIDAFAQVTLGANRQITAATLTPQLEASASDWYCNGRYTDDQGCNRECTVNEGCALRNCPAEEGALPLDEGPK